MDNIFEPQYSSGVLMPRSVEDGLDGEELGIVSNPPQSPGIASHELHK